MNTEHTSTLQNILKLVERKKTLGNIEEVLNTVNEYKEKISYCCIK